MTTVPKDDFNKSLARLESLVKAQLHHTEQSSRTGGWAGSKEQGQDEHKDGIEENGTDYNGVKKSLAAKLAKGGNLTDAEIAIIKGENPRAAIADKISKGETLTPAEGWALKSNMYIEKGADKPGKAGTPGECKDASSVPDTHGGENEDDEIEHDAKKSLDGEVQKSQTLQQGIEMSPFLFEFTRAMSEALSGTEARVAKSVAAAMAPLMQRVEALEKSHAASVSDQMEFNKSLADGVVAIGHQVEGTAKLADQAASAPARAPMSQLRSVPAGVQPIQKSFEGGPQLTKSQITETLCDMVKAKEIAGLEVVKFESTGQINPQLYQQVLAKSQGAGR